MTKTTYKMGDKMFTNYLSGMLQILNNMQAKKQWDSRVNFQSFYVNQAKQLAWYIELAKKFYLGFPLTSYGKTWMNLLANQ